MKGLLHACAVFIIFVMASCEKQDTPVALPERGSAEYGIVEMGEEYKDQIFFDFESGRVVHMSEINSWHLAFDASIEGYHIFMNGGADVMVYNTHETDFSKVTTAPKNGGPEWMFDASCGLADSTAIGDWRANRSLSKNEIYIVKLNSTYNPDNLKKFRIIAVDDKSYTIEYSDIKDNSGQIFTILKNHDYNYSYFSFDNGGYALQPDPPKDTWDIVFTRYRIIYYELDNFPYMVNGVLMNPYKTNGAKDTTHPFSELTNAHLLDMKMTNHRDVIGYEWKYYDFDTERYKIDRQTTYIIGNRKNQYWKLHFVDFYNNQGIKGSPSFEYQRIN